MSVKLEWMPTFNFICDHHEFLFDVIILLNVHNIQYSDPKSRNVCSLFILTARVCIGCNFWKPDQSLRVSAQYWSILLFVLSTYTSTNKHSTIATLYLNYDYSSWINSGHFISTPLQHGSHLYESFRIFYLLWINAYTYYREWVGSFSFIWFVCVCVCVCLVMSFSCAQMCFCHYFDPTVSIYISVLSIQFCICYY